MRTTFCQRSRLRGVSYPCKSEEGVAHDTERIQSLTEVNRSQEDISIAMAVSEDIRRLAEPDSLETSELDAWYMDQSEDDQRLPHRLTPNEAVPLEHLKKLGVLYWRLKGEEDPKLAAIREARGYSYKDVITVSPEKLPNYEQKIKSFFEEHMHTDEEIRFVLEGSGYFDVRDFDERWIRIDCREGDMIVLPEGIYHRFTLDSNNHIKAMRLFVGEPVWTPLNRPIDDHDSRKKYVATFQASEAFHETPGSISSASPIAAH